MLSFVIFVVDSRKSVAFGCILWKTTLCIEDFPLLQVNDRENADFTVCFRVGEAVVLIHFQ
jgi:hypothetical protein